MKRIWPVVFVVAAVLGVTSCAAETPLEQALAAFKKDDFEAARAFLVQKLDLCQVVLQR